MTTEDSTGLEMGPQLFGSGRNVCQVQVAATRYGFTTWHEFAKEHIGALLTYLHSPSYPSLKLQQLTFICQLLLARPLFDPF